jgi:hypothetical protein
LKFYLTGDQTLSYEQNLTGRTIAIAALSSVEWDILKNHLSLIIAAIDSALPAPFKWWIVVASPAKSNTRSNAIAPQRSRSSRIDLPFPVNRIPPLAA